MKAPADGMSRESPRPGSLRTTFSLSAHLVDGPRQPSQALYIRAPIPLTKGPTWSPSEGHPCSHHRGGVGISACELEGSGDRHSDPSPTTH